MPIDQGPCLSWRQFCTQPEQNDPPASVDLTPRASCHGPAVTRAVQQVAERGIISASGIVRL
ncbi:MAG: hypothetical protein K0R61_2729 [Microvirga sp.]|nr:hypothetical protein [Microvirga sp.]